MRKVFIKIIKFYQANLSERKFIFKKSSCMFIPSCSEYAKQAIEKHGVFKGLYLFLRRIIRCHPWQKNNYDPLK